MRIFVAGATGAIGKRLVPLLVNDGHDIVATTRTPSKVEDLRIQGAVPVVVDGLNKDAVMDAVMASQPDVIIHQMTAIGSMGNFKRFDDEFAATNRLRTDGTAYLLAAAQFAGVRKFVAQSYTGWPNERVGSRIKTEDDPLDSNPPKAMRKSLEAIRTLEEMVLKVHDVTGIVLRYGGFYGPGTSLSQGSPILEMVRRRKFPIVGTGAGVWSFIHIDDAAQATRLAIETEHSAIYNIVDDDPAEVSEWLPELCRAIGAKPPFHVPALLGRLAMGDAGVSMMTMIRGSSNAKAKDALGWQPRYQSWRDGFYHGLTEQPRTEVSIKGFERGR